MLEYFKRNYDLYLIKYIYWNVLIYSLNWLWVGPYDWARQVTHPHFNSYFCKERVLASNASNAVTIWPNECHWPFRAAGSPLVTSYTWWPSPDCLQVHPGWFLSHVKRLTRKREKGFYSSIEFTFCVQSLYTTWRGSDCFESLWK